MAWRDFRGSGPSTIYIKASALNRAGAFLLQFRINTLLKKIVNTLAGA